MPYPVPHINPTLGVFVRKISPASVRDDYLAQLGNLRTFHSRGFAAFTARADQSTLTEHSLLAAAVTWEGFVSDMFIAYINRDATRFKQHLKDSLENHVRTAATPQRVYAAYGALNFPAHLGKADVHALANGLGNNITFSNFGELENRAGTWLVTAYAARFTGLTNAQKAMVNAVVALRNHIAHRSQRSLDAMNDALDQGALHPTGIRRGTNRFHQVGAWLKATPPGQPQSRFETILDTLEAIGTTF